MTEFFLVSLDMEPQQNVITGMEAFMLYRALERALCNIPYHPSVTTPVEFGHVADVKKRKIPHNIRLNKMINRCRKDGYEPIGCVYMRGTELDPDSRESINHHLGREISYNLLSTFVPLFTIYDNNIFQRK